MRGEEHSNYFVKRCKYVVVDIHMFPIVSTVKEGIVSWTLMTTRDSGCMMDIGDNKQCTVDAPLCSFLISMLYGS